jgi:subtilisin family serine protease
LPKAYDGKGVIFGLIDTGMDFTHPDFKDSTGKSRVKWLWDQNSGTTGGDIPQPFNYGQEWNNQKLDSGLSDFIDWGSYGHGTRVAGIAAGNGKADSSYKGIATKADIMCVAIDFSSNGPVISDAVNYLVTKANMANQPLVINISLGDYYGSHDGQDLQAQIIDGMTANIPGRCVVAAAGNAGNYSFHLGYTVNADTNFTFMQNGSSSPLSYGLFADTVNFKNVQYTIGVYNGTNYQYEGNINFRDVNFCLNKLITDSIMFNGNRIGYVQTAAAINGGAYELDVNIIADSSSYFWTLETTGSGSFDAWDFDYLPLNQIPHALASIPKIIYYKAPDSLQTICTSFQCSNNVITVANYTEHQDFTTFGGLYVTQPGPYDTLSYDCSRGPTRDGRIKPEIAATGDNIVSTGALWACQDQAINYPNDGNATQDTMYMKFSGTSAAAPNVAGVVALYLQKNPTATNLDIKQAITGCTTIDNFTGNNLPNNTWGYGKLDAFDALLCNQTTNTKQLSVNNEQVKVFPNPAQQQIQFVFNNESGNADVVVYSVIGEKINTIHAYANNVNVPVQQLADGLYLYKIIKGNTMIAEGKFIKN